MWLGLLEFMLVIGLVLGLAIFELLPLHRARKRDEAARATKAPAQGPRQD